MRQLLCHGFSHETDSQGKEHPLVGDRLRFLDACQQVAGTGLCPPLQVNNIFKTQRIQVGSIVNQPLFKEQGNGFGANGDVHALAGDKMFDAPFDLGRAFFGVGTVMHSLILIAHQRGVAIRTMTDKRHLVAQQKARLLIHTGNFGDDLPALLHKNHIANMQIEGVDGIFVIE